MGRPIVRLCLAAPFLLGVLLGGCSGEETPPPSVASDGTAGESSGEVAAPAPVAPFAMPPIVPDLPPELGGLEQAHFGDLDAMVERRLVRVLTVYRLGGYFLDGAEERGVTYEAARALEEQLNERFGKRHLKIFVVMIPVHRDQLIPALLQGYGDIVAASLTNTLERELEVDFSDPMMRDVAELIVTGPSAPPLAQLEDLSGTTLRLRRSSSYWSSVERLNERLRTEGKPAVELVEVSESLEDEDLLEMVHAGLLPMIVVDGYKASFWERILDGIEVREDLVLRSGGEIAWAFRKQSPQLAEEVNRFLGSHGEGTLFGNVVLERYFGKTKWVRNALAGEDLARFDATLELFRDFGDRYGFEYLMLAAQGYQESGLDQSRRSPAGAVGIMQLLPSTAADPNVGIPDINVVENNIHAGAKYMDFLRSRYFEDEAIAEADRVLFAFAAYNAGPSRVRGLRRKAAEMGLDPNSWFGNVEIVAAREIGRETVQYVGNICKYYLAYQLLEEKRVERERSRAEMFPAQAPGPP